MTEQEPTRPTSWLVTNARLVVIFLFGCVLALVVVLVVVIAGRQAQNAPKTTEKLDAAQESLNLLRGCLVHSKDPQSCYQQNLQSQAQILGRVAQGSAAAASYAEGCARQLVAAGVPLERLPDAIYGCVTREFSAHGAPLPELHGGVPSASPSPKEKP